MKTTWKEEQIDEALSYRRPMLVTELKIYRDGNSYYVCPRCGITMEREFMGFCDRCGQRLNWFGYKRVKLIYVLPKGMISAV